MAEINTKVSMQGTFELPSQGKIYSKDAGIPEKITLRAMTTAEQKLRLRNSSNIEIMRNILQACIVSDKEINIDNMKVYDAKYLFFQLRVLSTLKEDYVIELTCPSCGARFTNTINLKEIPIIKDSEKVVEPFVFTLPASGDEIGIKALTLKENIELSNSIVKLAKQFPNTSAVELAYVPTLAKMISTVNGQELVSLEKEQYVESLHFADQDELGYQIKELESKAGVIQECWCKCPSCEEEISHEIPITNEFFSPSRKRAE